MTREELDREQKMCHDESGDAEAAVPEVYEFAYPFVRDTFFDRADFDDYGKRCEGNQCWKPGVRQEQCAAGDFHLVADGVGSQIVTVVSRHKPGRWPARVFFTRRWRDPDGKEFGKIALHVTTAGSFTRLRKGYRHRFVRCEPFVVGKLNVPSNGPNLAEGQTLEDFCDAYQRANW